jgi:hypothetical protein
LKRTNGTAAGIAERAGIVVSPGFEAVRILVEHSYLSEVLVLAEAAVKGTADERHMKELHGLFNRFSLFDIRNAISHPNRTFGVLLVRCAASLPIPSLKSWASSTSPRHFAALGELSSRRRMSGWKNGLGDCRIIFHPRLSMS